MKFDIEMIKVEEASVEIQDYVCRLSLHDKLDQNTTNHFELFILTLVNGGIRRIILDLSNMKYVDSSGIGKIINIAKVLRKVKGNITVTNCPSQILQTFQLVRLDNFIHIFNSNEEGFNYLRFI